MPEHYISEWPPFSPQDEARREGAIVAARLMVNAALTAPSAGGVPQNEAHLVYGQKELEALARKMEELAYHNPKNKILFNMFKYEAASIREQTDAVVFVGGYRVASDPRDSGCGGCGGFNGFCWLYTQREVRSSRIDMTGSTTTELVDGPLCRARVNPLGYAVGAALWMAHRLLVDARPLMTLGIAGMKLGYCPSSHMVVGIPVAVYHKNPYIDLMPDYNVLSPWNAVQAVRKFYPVFRGVKWYDHRGWIPRSAKDGGQDEEAEEKEEE
ncbi:MAG: hypothetical protein HYU86_11975 [Chloroflexi bacterium]|nr:hypothetical protein [Chloroflexota bacterium]